MTFWPGARAIELEVPLRLPVAGVATRRVTLIEGPMGWGEISPLPGFRCPREAAVASAKEAACEGWPPPRRDRVPVNALIPALGPTSAARQAADAVRAGFGCVKVKVGDEGDMARVEAVRNELPPGCGLRLDANGAWDLDTAVTRVAALARFGVELFEQPVASLDDLAKLRRRVQVPLAADESVRTLQDARRLRALDAADAVVLKVQPLGGVRAALAVAEAAGVPAVVTSMLETSVGLAAGAALAGCLPDLPFACGLGTAVLLDVDVTLEPLLPEAGLIAVRPVVPDPGLLARLAVQ